MHVRAIESDRSLKVLSRCDELTAVQHGHCHRPVSFDEITRFLLCLLCRFVRWLALCEFQQFGAQTMGLRQIGADEMAYPKPPRRGEHLLFIVELLAEFPGSHKILL